MINNLSSFNYLSVLILLVYKFKIRRFLREFNDIIGQWTMIELGVWRFEFYSHCVERHLVLSLSQVHLSILSYQFEGIIASVAIIRKYLIFAYQYRIGYQHDTDGKTVHSKSSSDMVKLSIWPVVGWSSSHLVSW